MKTTKHATKIVVGVYGTAAVIIAVCLLVNHHLSEKASGISKALSQVYVAASSVTLSRSMADHRKTPSAAVDYQIDMQELVRAKEEARKAGAEEDAIRKQELMGAAASLETAELLAGH